MDLTYEIRKSKQRWFEGEITKEKYQNIVIKLCDKYSRLAKTGEESVDVLETCYIALVQTIINPIEDEL